MLLRQVKVELYHRLTMAAEMRVVTPVEVAVPLKLAEASSRVETQLAGMIPRHQLRNPPRNRQLQNQLDHKYRTVFLEGTNMKQQLLSEHLNPVSASLREQRTGGDLYLNGIMMQAALKNGNGREYPLSEISKAVDEAAERIKSGHFILGELNHPDVLSINLANVSHAITEIRMDGNNAIGKMKLLNTPSGNIAKGLIEGGVRLGVSSRGTGNVNETGSVSDFSFVTVDIVSQPSAPDAYPDVIAEAMGSKKVLSLAEAMVHDPKAQAYFKKEMKSFLEALAKGKK
jgi:hypothetical protein